jgi:hypothetical protein
MATNRTKIDWAYKQSRRLLLDKVYSDKYDQVRAIARALRKAYRDGVFGTHCRPVVGGDIAGQDY